MGCIFFLFSSFFSGRESERKLAVLLAPSSELPSDSSWTSGPPDTLTRGHLDDLAPDKKSATSPLPTWLLLADCSPSRVVIELSFSKWIFHSSQCNDAVLVISPIISHSYESAPVSTMAVIFTICIFMLSCYLLIQSLSVSCLCEFCVRAIHVFNLT